MWLHFLLVGSYHGGLLPGLPGWAWPIVTILAWGPFALFALTLAAGLRGLHAVSRVRAAFALLVALAISGLIRRALHTAFEFHLRSPHFVLYFDHGIPMWDILW
jgi:hypothetical protein